MRRFLAAAVLLLATASAADAGTITTTAGVAAGPLTLSYPERVTLVAAVESGARIVSGELGTATVVDARGSGEGWRLRIAAGELRGPTGAIDQAQLSIVSVAVTPGSGRAPINRVRYPVAVPFGAPGTVDFFSAASGSGMGTVHLTPRVALELPPGGPFEGTLTVDVAAGP